MVGVFRIISIASARPFAVDPPPPALPTCCRARVAAKANELPGATPAENSENVRSKVAAASPFVVLSTAYALPMLVEILGLAFDKYEEESNVPSFALMHSNTVGANEGKIVGNGV